MNRDSSLLVLTVKRGKGQGPARAIEASWERLGTDMVGSP